eukprot:scaffold7417_cov77-Phaeocystis_antarctica.AAC.1
MSKDRQGGLCTTRTQSAQGLEHELDGLNLCVRRTARELRVRARQDGVRATRNPHTHTHTHTHGSAPIVSCCRCRAGVGTVRVAERRAPLSFSSASQIS